MKGRRAVTELQIATIPARLHRNEANPTACLTVFAHGGGFTSGTLDDYDQLCRNLLAGAGGTLISVDYRLAPAHPFPAAIDDVHAVAVWAAENRNAFVASDAPFIIAGDSAGGCLAAGVAQRLVAEGGPVPDGQMLIYPMIEHYSATPAGFHELSRDFPPSFEDIRGAWDAYLDPATGPALPYAVPPRATSFAGLPAALVLTAANDPLRFEGEAYADRLASAGVAVQRRRHPGVAHSFLVEPPGSQEVDAAISEIAAWVGTLKC